MKCPYCERGEMIPLESGKSLAYQCQRCHVVVPDVLERLLTERRHPWRRGYKKPLSDRVSAIFDYVRTKEDK